jgi:hypothetical protein
MRNEREDVLAATSNLQKWVLRTQGFWKFDDGYRFTPSILPAKLMVRIAP